MTRTQHRPGGAPDPASLPYATGTRVPVEVTRLEERFAVVSTPEGHVGLLHKGAITRSFFVRNLPEVFQIGDRFVAAVDGATFSGLIAFSLVRLDGTGLKMRRQPAEVCVDRLQARLLQMGWEPLTPEERRRLTWLVMLRGEDAFRSAADRLLGGDLLHAVLDRVEARLRAEQDHSGDAPAGSRSGSPPTGRRAVV